MSEKQVIPRMLVIILLQMVASLSWIISVFVYKKGTAWEAGDALQMVAAVAWTVSNGLSIPDAFREIPTTDYKEKPMEIKSTNDEGESMETL